MFTVTFKTILITAIVVVFVLCVIFTYLLGVGSKPDDQEDIEKENNEQERYLTDWTNRRSRNSR